MIILLGSKNPSKKRAVELALEELGISDYSILSYDVPSNVDSKPIGYEIIRGADNRNSALKTIAETAGIQYDYLCSIEGGYSLDESGLPFIVTYCITENSDGKKSTGKSLGLRLSRAMFDYVKRGNSLNKVIEQITDCENNKHNQGITGYLSCGLYKREIVDKDAVVSSFIPIIYSEERKKLNAAIKTFEKK